MLFERATIFFAHLLLTYSLNGSNMLPLAYYMLFFIKLYLEHMCTTRCKTRVERPCEMK